MEFMCLGNFAIEIFLFLIKREMTFETYLPYTLEYRNFKKTTYLENCKFCFGVWNFGLNFLNVCCISYFVLLHFLYWYYFILGLVFWNRFMTSVGLYFILLFKKKIIKLSFCLLLIKAFYLLNVTVHGFCWVVTAYQTVQFQYKQEILGREWHTSSLQKTGDTVIKERGFIQS